MKQVLSLAIVMLTGLGIFIQSRSAADPGGHSPCVYQLGEQVADFDLPGVDGSTHSLADLYGSGAKGIIVIFTCNTCPVSQRNEERIIELHEKMVNQGYPVLAINANDPGKSPGDNMEAMIQRAENKDYPFLYVQDKSQETARAFGAAHTPQVFLLDGDRRLRYTGAIDDNPYNAGAVNQRYVEEAVERLKVGGTPDPAKTKSVGCSIKYRS